MLPNTMKVNASIPYGRIDGLGQGTHFGLSSIWRKHLSNTGQDDEYNEYLNHFDIRDETVNMQLILRGE